MKIHKILYLLLVFAAESRVDACGMSYALPSGSSTPYSVAFSPDNSLLATANYNSANVTLFHVTAGTLSTGISYSLPSGSYPSSVTFSPDGTLLAVAHYSQVTVFNVSSGVLTGSASYALPSGSTGAWTVAFSQNGSLLATGNYSSNDVTVFSVSAGVLSGGTSYKLPSGSTYPYSVAFSPNNSYLVTANHNSSNVTLFTVSGSALNGGTSYALPSGSAGPMSVTFSPSGSQVATGNAGSNNVTVFTLSGGVLSGGTSYALPSGSSYPYSVAFSPNGSFLATANDFNNGSSSNITVFNVSGGVLSAATPYALPASASTSPIALAFSPNGAYLATANTNSNDVTMLNVGAWCTPPTTTPAPTTPAPSTPAPSQTIFTTAPVSTNTSLCLSSGTSYFLPTNSQGLHALAFSPNSLFIATSNYSSGDVTVFTANTNGTLGTGVSYALPSTADYPQDLAFSPDNAYLAVACSPTTGTDGNVTVFAVNSSGALSGGTPYSLLLGAGIPSALAFSPNGSFLAVASYNSTNNASVVTMFKVSGGALTVINGYPLPASSSGPISIAFSKDGSVLVTGNSGTQDVTVFNVGSGGALNAGTSYALGAGSTAAGYSLAFSPDGSYLAVADGLSNVVIFTATGGVLSNRTSFAVPSGYTINWAVSFSPDNTHLAVTIGDVSNNDNLAVFQVSNGVLSNGTVYLLPTGALARSLSFSPNGSFIVVGVADTTGPSGAAPRLVVFGSIACPTTGSTATTSGAVATGSSATTTSVATTSAASTTTAAATGSTSDGSSITTARILPLMLGLLGLQAMRLRAR